jgi:G3E family GTPase
MSLSQSPKRPQPIPIIVVTGFLGAGKTSLLNRLVSEDALKDTLLIVNEFGEVGLDHLLIETLSDDMVLLSAGCLCCSIRGDLITTLEEMLRRRDNNRIAPFSRIIIETTGLADPAPVLNAILLHPYLRLRYQMNGLVTVVDAMNGLDTLKHHKEAIRQVAMADHIFMTKTDLCEEGRPDKALITELETLNPVATITTLTPEHPSAETLVKIMTTLGPFSLEGKSPDLRAWLGEHDGKHHHHGKHKHEHHDHSHDINRHSAHIRAHVIRHQSPISAHQLDLFLDLLRSAHGAKLLRVKGLIALDDDQTRPLILHAVQHILHPPIRLETWPDADHTTRIVFILDDLDSAFVSSLWDAFTKQPRVDQPDQEALLNNPLALIRGS